MFDNGSFLRRRRRFKKKELPLNGTTKLTDALKTIEKYACPSGAASAESGSLHEQQTEQESSQAAEDQLATDAQPSGPLPDTSELFPAATPPSLGGGRAPADSVGPREASAEKAALAEPDYQQPVGQLGPTAYPIERAEAGPAVASVPAGRAGPEGVASNAVQYGGAAVAANFAHMDAPELTPTSTSGPAGAAGGEGPLAMGPLASSMVRQQQQAGALLGFGLYERVGGSPCGQLHAADALPPGHAHAQVLVPQARGPPQLHAQLAQQQQQRLLQAAGHSSSQLGGGGPSLRPLQTDYRPELEHQLQHHLQQNHHNQHHLLSHAPPIDYLPASGGFQHAMEASSMLVGQLECKQQALYYH